MSVTVKTFRAAVTDALRHEMRRDPSVIVLGEDVGRHGGARGASRGLWEEFGPARVIDTPISELAIASAACGAALRGLRPVAEVYFADILTLMTDPLVSAAATVSFATAGALRVPCVIRGGDASRPDGGPHQNTFASWFAHVPGLKVVVPATPADAKGLLIAAIRDDNPVIVLEPLQLYDVEGPVPDGDHVVPLGVADVKAEGTDVTIAAVGASMPRALAARDRWAARGVSIEVVDLRTLRPLDVATIRASVGKTGRLVVCHEGWATYGIGAEVVACVAEGPELLLRAPARRVGTLETHIPASSLLAQAVLPNAARIDEAVEEVMAGAAVPS